MATAAVIIFVLTYAGVAVGRYPRLVIDRTGFALVGAVAMVVAGVLHAGQAVEAVHIPTLLLLYGLMIVSAQLRLGGFCTWLARRVVAWASRPRVFLLLLMLVSGLLASVLANDIICLAFTPVLVIGLRRRGLNPVPFLLGLAMGTNVGSAATIIGNPQTMLIGQVAGLSFWDYLTWCAPPSLLGLIATYVVLLGLFRRKLVLANPTGDSPAEPDWPDFNPWQSGKGLAAAAIVVALMFVDFPREWSVLAVGGMLLMSRRMHTRAMLGVVDWHLITMFAGLFIVVHGLGASGVPEVAVRTLEQHGIDLARPGTLAVIAVAVSNVVSNVPATMLLIPHMPAGSTPAWYVLSLATTYAGNLLTIGSMANLIVIEQARLHAVHITFGQYARAGICVTTVNLIILLAWFAIRS